MAPARQLELLSTVAQAKSWRSRIGGAADRIGFVPTMGALHAGHAELLRRARESCDVVVLSIFVNPTQFGPGEDLAKYPRTYDADLALAREYGVDAVFTPTSDEMYPAGFSTCVEETAMALPLCGKFRPGHFRGVTTVVLKLFNIVRPQVAYFGLKDAQQFFVLERMTRDLDLAVTLVGVPTVRESDGLAMSSRNAYLSPAERATAPAFYQTLRDASAALRAGQPVAETLAAAREILRTAGFRAQYLECLELPDLLPCARCAPDRGYLLAGAVFLGSTRLIDNVIWPTGA